MPSAGTRMTLTPPTFAPPSLPPLPTEAPAALDVIPTDEAKTVAKPFYKRPLFWFLLIGTAAVGGGVYFYVRRRRARL